MYGTLPRLFTESPQSRDIPFTLGISESGIKIKINLNFICTFLCGASKGFEAPSVKEKIQVTKIIRAGLGQEEIICHSNQPQLSDVQKNFIGPLFPFYTLREKCPYSELLWFAFFRIWTEYGEILMR